MKNFDVIENSLVAIFDIENFSKRNPENQARLVGSFVELLGHHLRELSNLKPDAFSSGDGAIVSIGRSCKVDRPQVQQFFDFVIAFTTQMLREGLIIRVAVNYSDRDRIIPLNDSDPICGECIQIGDAINIATRIISFCEPREIMLSESLVELFRKLDMEDTVPLHKNDQLVTKHGLVLNTYSYEPPDALQKYFYSPKSPVHAYKRFTSFPPITTDNLQFFRTNGLEFELRKVISNAYDAMRYINDTKTFLSWNQVLNVLISLNYDHEDNVYVLSRNDNAAGFWTQSRRNTYIRHLEKRSNEKPSKGYINQTRVMVYDDNKHPTTATATPEELMADHDIYHDLNRLHKTNSFYSYPSTLLFRYEKLSELLFGFTLSTKHGYAIISVPEADGIDPHKLHTKYIGEVLRQHKGYDAADGPMKAIITADKDYVDSLRLEMDAILEDPDIYRIK